MIAKDDLPCLNIGRAKLLSEVVYDPGKDMYTFVIGREVSYTAEGQLRNARNRYAVNTFRDEDICPALEDLLRRGLQAGDNIVISLNVVISSPKFPDGHYEERTYYRIRQIEFANDDYEMDCLRQARHALTAKERLDAAKAQKCQNLNTNALARFREN